MFHANRHADPDDASSAVVEVALKVFKVQTPMLVRAVLLLTASVYLADNPDRVQAASAVSAR